ncbi:hypothetical protein HRbin14_01503 [bacterium HR14]|nr:hypothetical protein HRbin14_01503 [bacterium HR14]
MHNLLLLQHFLQGANLVANFGGALKLQRFCRLFHLGFQLLDQVVALALQKQHHILHNFAVLFRVCQSCTRRQAPPHVIVETRALNGFP